MPSVHYTIDCLYGHCLIVLAVSSAFFESSSRVALSWQNFAASKFLVAGEHAADRRCGSHLRQRRRCG